MLRKPLLVARSIVNWTRGRRLTTTISSIIYPDLLPIPGHIRRPHHHLEQIHKQQKECTKRRNEIQQLFVASGKLSPIKALTFHVHTIFLIRSLNKLFQSRKFHNKAAESAQKHKRALAKDRGWHGEWRRSRRSEVRPAGCSTGRTIWGSFRFGHKLRQLMCQFNYLSTI